jgi:SSS family solute:Na+ symporter
MTPAPYVLMLGALLSLATGWNPTVCLVTGTVATTVYLFAGGFRSDVHTDVLEFLLMFLGFAVILPFAYGAYGGVEFLQSHLPPLHLTWDGGNSWQFIVVWFLIALWTLVDPAFHQRCYAAASGEVARRGILWSILFWFLFDAMTAVAGLYARAALPSLPQPVMAYPLLAEAVLPPVAKGFFYVGMLATIMSTLNTLAFVSASTLGRDIVWRARGGEPGGDEARTTRWGLVVTGALAVALALLLPSVIRLWYTIGTIIVPGLLLPVLTSYYPRAAVRPRWTFAVMLCGWLASLGWLAAGWSQGVGSTDHYPLGVEPMFVGLAVSGAIWGIGRRW